MTAAVVSSLLEDLASMDTSAPAAANEAQQVHQPAADAAQQGQQGLAIVDRLSQLLGWALGAPTATEGGDGEDEGAALRRVAKVVRHEGKEGSGGAAEDRGGYDPYVPGRIVYMFRCPEPAPEQGNVVEAPPAAAEATAEEGAGGKEEGAAPGEAPEPLALALLQPASAELRRIRLTRTVVSDHFVDSLSVCSALGCSSLAAKR
jgi:hypothetical protein